MTTHFQGGLYPTVAVSDAFNTLCHAAAAYISYVAFPSQPASLGFALVVVAAAIGTLRFGFSESLFAKANEDLAQLAAYTGLPLVGLTFIHVGGLWSFACSDYIVICVCGAVLTAISRSLSAKVEELLKILLNVFAFIGPTAWVGYLRGDTELVLAVVLFAVAGIAVKPERHSTLFGMRRENIFHYMIGVASYGMAKGLSRITS
jgi:hypothetical protein